MTKNGRVGLATEMTLNSHRSRAYVACAHAPPKLTTLAQSSTMADGVVVKVNQSAGI